jgi:hypothetical protein
MDEQLRQPLDGLELGTFAMRSIWSIGTTKILSSRSIDLARKKIHSSALLYYGSGNEVESFAEADRRTATRRRHARSISLCTRVAHHAAARGR